MDVFVTDNCHSNLELHGVRRMLSRCTESLGWLESQYIGHDSKLPLRLISRYSSTHHACWRSSNVDARILLMLNIVTPDGYSDLSEDMGISKACAFFGQEDTSKWAPGESQQTAIEAQRADKAADVGCVYVMYVDTEVHRPVSRRFLGDP
ncbi:hypothetical protein DFJ58DRAFT_754372 [Suillus subalutaceus]|uniref:uncharacterized protein n=1 Tax=Suillus subalutaceus TaxID=48586 RepID=UPI001B85E3A6|nr:uncharacterized protein DFJ58DRAFT_754372 [Suillus subalutaceus]KAG1876458.1 hypothetical protein DFJ58DRAFT_754372 [Suillus subalutaceus]